MNRLEKPLKVAAIVLSVSLLSAAVTLGAEEKRIKKDHLNRKEPIQITSDVLEYMNDQRLVVFSGNAVAIQGDIVIRSDKLMLYYKNAGDDEKSQQTKDAEKTGDLERIEAKGRVSVTRGSRVATGDEAVYDQGAEKIVMTGNAIMREGKNVVRGHKITLLINEDRGIVEAQERKRVTAIIYPKEKSDRAEPGK